MRRLSESTWGDMRHRSSGKVIRKEDDVNFMDFDTFAEYIKNTYSERGNWFAVRESEDGKSRSIEIDIIYGKEIDLSFNVVEGEIYNILVNGNKNYVDIPGLKEIFNVNIIGSSSFSVYEKNWTISNNTFVKLIEFFLDKKTNESVWGDMRKKSSGETIRQEDDIISYDGQQMVEYIINNYRINDNSSQPRYYDVDNTLDVPVIIWKDPKDPKIYHTNIVFYDYDNNVIYVAESTYEDTLNKIKSNPDFSTFNYEGNYLAITPKTGDVNNKFLIKVIDFIIGNVDDKAIPVLDKRYVNESVWGDMRKRSSGEVVRKEDVMFTFGDMDQVCEYIRNRYGSKIDSVDYDHSAKHPEIYTKINNDITFKTKHNMFGKLKYVMMSYSTTLDHDFFETLEKKFDVKLHDNSSYFASVSLTKDSPVEKEIREKDGTCTYKTYVAVVDFFMKWLIGDVNESVWGDMRKRSSGEQTRKEDNVNLLDVDGLYDYIKSKYEKRVFYLDKSDFGSINKRNIVVDVLDNVSLYTKYEKNGKMDNILLSWTKVKISMPFFDKLKERFNVQMPNVNRRTITEKDGTCTNQTYVDVIDFFLDNIDNMLVNESVWGDMRKKSSGEQIRKEDEMSDADFDFLTDCLIEFATRVVWDGVKVGFEKLSDCIRKQSNDYKDVNVENVISYVDRNWTTVSKELDDFIDHEEKEKIRDSMNESVWGDMRKKSSGSEMRKEDEVLTDMEINSLNEFTLMYCREERAHYIQNHIVPPPPSRRKENDYEGLIKYIEDRRDENMFTNVGDYNKIIRYIKKNWDKLDMDTYIKKWICSPSVMKGTKIVECDGVPGGLTPADVGGMGAAYFPGPNGEPGSGDLPSPTGIVYHQVAPYTVFLKGLKKKKKKKKFRIEDEPCAHSKNSKVYDYVDDYREYVDRTYNNMDKRK